MKYFLICLLLCSGAYAQELEAFRIFDSRGKEVSFGKMMARVSQNQVVLFGEFHDNPISHWLEWNVLMELNKKVQGPKLAVGFEMFELHQEKALNDYIVNKSYRVLKDSTELWTNFKTDYKPVLDSAISRGNIPFAANVTRKYASLVFKKGLSALDSLPEDEKKWMAPLPFPFDSTLTQYVELIRMGKEMHASGINFAYAQAIKDATMGYSIMQHLKKGEMVYFLNGAFHSDFHQGIMWYIGQYAPGTKVGTITTVSQKDVRKLQKEHLNRADFIVVVNETMLSTH
ncbi:ChaN family lipoprotein [Fluviicola chungangensis]|uniref:ChaN family lipoprotein n=1 Tax=Fluviicola chungangensis TaxID=2597671 RepID=A0A556N3I4_9FLAO|nr:ChaN family lipoprotein [Fluviicola chungangensis]TSJ46712.1 ChaN family lipoprotein [Fluviicola chungangensis]